MFTALVACFVGMVSVGLGVLLESTLGFPSAHFLIILLGYSALISIFVVLGVMFLIWIPVHDSIVGTDNKAHRSLFIPYPTFEAHFVSAGSQQTTPPPRFNHR